MAEGAAISIDAADGRLEVACSGDWSVGGRIPSSRPVEDAMRKGASRVSLQSRGLGRWDAALVSFGLSVARAAQARGLEFDASGLPQGARDLLALALATPPRADAAVERREPSLLSRWARGTGTEVLETLAFVGDLTRAAGRLAIGRARFQRADFLAFMRDAGFDALPVVALISFLVGAILAFVGAVQLSGFGAQLFVADLVGLAMARDIGAIMTAIIIAGRTGASYAARIGTMQGAEEIDALRTMGLDPVEFLALPRVLALVLMTPFLVLYADLLGILGGAMVGVTLPGVTLLQYFSRTVETLTLGQFVGGVFKGTIYGALVAIAGCLRGMQCGRSAAAVGAATTSAVVTGIIYVIVAAAILTMIFHVLEI